MKSDKIYINDLLQAISSETQHNKTVVEKFLKSIFAEIEEGLRKDKLVKINGFGSFKLQWNEARKSVNVNTGEEIIIEGYNKVTFIPDTNLKNEINEPFSHLETIKLNEDNTEKVEEKNIGSVKSEEVNVIKGLLSDIEEMDKKETKTTQTEEKENKVNTLLNEINDLQNNINNKNLNKNNTMKPETKKPEVPKSVQTPSKPGNRTRIPIEKTPDSGGGNWKVMGISICILCGVAILLCFLFINNDSKVEEEIITTEVITEPKTEAIKEEVVEKVATIFDQARIYDEFIATEYLPEGSRLAWLSTKYYGTQEFWVYIYEANMSVVEDPNVILVNTKIRVPKLPTALIDKNNPACIEYALELKEKYVKQ